MTANEASADIFFVGETYFGGRKKTGRASEGGDLKVF